MSGRVKWIVLAGGIFLSGCVMTGDRMQRLQRGMTREQVIETVGAPDAEVDVGDYEALGYTDRYISGWSPDKTDYTVVLRDGVVAGYWPGQVRNNTELGAFVNVR